MPIASMWSPGMLKEYDIPSSGSSIASKVHLRQGEALDTAYLAKHRHWEMAIDGGQIRRFVCHIKIQGMPSNNLDNGGVGANAWTY
jgi:hypothetical protein